RSSDLRGKRRIEKRGQKCGSWSVRWRSLRALPTDSTQNSALAGQAGSLPDFEPAPVRGPMTAQWELGFRRKRLVSGAVFFVFLGLPPQFVFEPDHQGRPETNRDAHRHGYDTPNSQVPVE